MPSRTYNKVVTIGSVSIYSVTGVPAFNAALGSLAIRDDVGETYQNTDGAGTWVLIGGGAGGLPFVATNEFYIDTTAVADAANRIYPTIEAALNAAGSLPANASVVIRLREGQFHSWDMSTGTAADGSRNIHFYSHNSTLPTGAILGMTGTLATPGAPQPRYMTFRNLRLTKFTDNFAMNAPWNFQFDGVRFQSGVIFQLDSTNDDIEVRLNNCDALESDVGAVGRQPLRILLDQGGANLADVICTNCRIDLTAINTDPTTPAVTGASPAGGRRIRYTDCTLRVLGEESLGERGVVGAQWNISGAAGGNLVVAFENTNIGVVAGSAATLFDAGDPSNTLTVLWENVNISVECAGDGEGVTHTNFTFGDRTDGEATFNPLENPNRVMLQRSKIDNADRTPGFPIDPPRGCLAQSPIPESSRRHHETIWQAAIVDEGDPEEQIWWLGANNTNQWEANTTNASPTSLLEMPFQNFEWLPIEVNQGGEYLINYYVTGASGSGGTFAFSVRLSVVIDVTGGTISILSQTTEILTEAVATDNSVTASVDAVNNGIAVTVNQGTEGPGNINWYGYSHVHRLNA